MQDTTASYRQVLNVAAIEKKAIIKNSSLIDLATSRVSRRSYRMTRNSFGSFVGRSSELERSALRRCAQAVLVSNMMDGARLQKVAVGSNALKSRRAQLQQEMPQTSMYALCYKFTIFCCRLKVLAGRMIGSSVQNVLNPVQSSQEQHALRSG